jgi:hypothetical protein
MIKVILDRTLSDNSKKLDYVADLVVQPTLNVGVRVPEHFKPNIREILMCFDINHVITDEHIQYYQQPLEKVAPSSQTGTGQNTIIYFNV